MSRRRRPTSTSSFGVGRRESHDASGFYDRFTAPVLSQHDAVNSSPIKDKIVTGDARHMDEVEDASVALVVTSPPYFAGKEYEEALGEGHIPASYLDYLGMLTEVFAECVRTLEPGGRIAVNVANLGRKPYRSLSADVITILQDRLGLLLRGEVIWHKARGASGSCAWGSFRSPANPVLRDLTERVVIASKGRFDRALTRPVRQARGLPSEISLTKEEFIEATTDVWELPSERATRVGHPAPFPVELPLRLIELYTYEGDLVLDPFIGSGTTAAAAVRSHRHYVGYDTESEYVLIAEQRVERGARPAHRDATATRCAKPGATAPPPAWSPPSCSPDAGSSTWRRATRQVAGVDVAYTGRDRTGRQWLFDFSGRSPRPTPGCDGPTPCGGPSARRRSSTRRGPRPRWCCSPRPHPLPAAPGTRRGARSAEAAPPGGIGAVYDVVEIGSPDAEARLCRYASHGLEPSRRPAPRPRARRRPQSRRGAPRAR